MLKSPCCLVEKENMTTETLKGDEMKSAKGCYELECDRYAALSRGEQEAEEIAIEASSADDYRSEMGAAAMAEIEAEEDHERVREEMEQEEFWTFPNEVTALEDELRGLLSSWVGPNHPARAFQLAAIEAAEAVLDALIEEVG